ncbi:hypothetical protein BDV38DRAFT_182910 [Aspergillus pseudotamarii]|uniref:2EXR domain-containing protein n=1 Tax=Aspergillus pseudotamarii TaxID=132259 RepID=A0A5N6SI84_ASPPS|nr:uncharacterized protein BDV38DRAFT_182910 [Aspergillus pseudotamarii]KAE8133617.1 hypothetical protein BDV38DRAFT_182910 [Aspergillus pseudotamarii]
MSPTFPLFPLLPPEIRHYIWHLSLTHARVIRISCDRGILPNSRRYARCFRADCANPPQLQVNTEARHVALRCYAPYFRTKHMPHCCIYLAPDQDVVHLHEAVLAYLSTAERAALRRLIIDVQDYGSFGSYWMDSLCSMDRLQEIVLVVLPGTSTPYRVYDHLPVADDEIVWMLKAAFVEGVRTTPEWAMPRVKVISHDGTAMGDIVVEADDLEIS